MNQDHHISNQSLQNLYSLAFSKINTAIMNHYKQKYGGNIGLIIKHKIFIILRNGVYFESVRMDKIDYIFNSIDVKTLRKNLKEM